jgi:ankyrin repeat protein
MKYLMKSKTFTESKNYLKKYEKITEYLTQEVLLNAIQFNNKNVEKIINNYKGDINFRDSFNNLTPFMYAVYYERKSILEPLVKKGADVNLKNGDGETPLVMAANLNLYSIIIDLIEKYNADMLIPDNDGLFFIDYLNEPYFDYIKEKYPKQYQEIQRRKDAQKFNL